MRYLLFPLLISFFSSLQAQERILYVNTDNLILRDLPEKRYNVFAILHAGATLVEDTGDHGYKDDKAISSKFYEVKLKNRDTPGDCHFIGGWVEKKYIVRKPEMVKQTLVKKDLPYFDEIHVINICGYYNDKDFPPPKYKGGEPNVRGELRSGRYLLGPKGGCYFYNKHGKKVYVDRSYCN